jgi:hypothetical protein
MKQWLGAIVLVGIMAGGAFADKGPKIEVIDNKLSIDAEAVPLSRLLRLLDLATGMKSRIVPELANRNISVKFSGLEVNEGIRKIFQGQPVDYMMIGGQGIIVTAASQSVASTDAPPVYSTPQQMDQPFIPDFNPALNPAGNQQQPAMIQTPFGMIANPRAGQPIAPNAPLSGPGQQQNPLFPGMPVQQQQQQPQQMIPGMQVPGMQFPGGVPTNPFGAPSPFGTPGGTAPPTNTNPFNPSPLFNNPAPGGPGAPPR